MEPERFPTTEYFRAVRIRPDRAIIQDEWIKRAIEAPVREAVQVESEGGGWVPEAGHRSLRVVLLPDRMTVHNAFFDRTFKP